MVYVVFKNRVVIAVAATYSEAQLLMVEAENAEGAYPQINYTIVEVESGAYIENIAPPKRVKRVA